MRFTYLALFLLVFSFTRISLAQKLIVEGYGDSVAAGFGVLENFSKPAGEIKQLHRKMVLARVTSALHLGSIEQKSAKHAHAEYAFPYVIAQKLKARGNDVFFVNRAATGARVRDIAGQIVGNPAVHGEKVIAFFMVGHNDLCRGDGEGQLPLVKTVTEYHRALMRWDLSHTNATAFIVPIADIPRVYETLDRFQWASHATPNQVMTCRESWTRRFPVCKYFTNLFFDGRLRATVEPQRVSLNASVGNLANDMNQRTQRGNQFIYLDGALDGEYIPDQFAVDCFHLSTRGQFALAEVILNLINGRI